MDTDIARPNYSTPFTTMAEAITHNAGSTFGGAVVIVAPDGTRIETLMLDASGEIAQFWSTIKTRVEIVIANLQDQQRVAQSYGRR